MSTTVYGLELDIVFKQDYLIHLGFIVKIKHSTFIILLPLAVSLLTSCFTLQRSTGSGYGGANAAFEDRYQRDVVRDSSINQTAYQMGKDPSSLSQGDIHEIRKRQKVKELERTLNSNKEKEQYSKILPWLKNDEEKISFLSIPSLEGRQQWINGRRIWDRAQAPQADMKILIESQDIALGMPQEYVRKAWGDPVSVETSGNPLYKNERWKYQKQTSSPSGYRKEIRTVYFEGGRVVGWETE